MWDLQILAVPTLRFLSANGREPKNGGSDCSSFVLCGILFDLIYIMCLRVDCSVENLRLADVSDD